MFLASLELILLRMWIEMPYKKKKKARSGDLNW